MVTEMSIGEEDFQQLQAQEGVAITFCLKEFRVRFLPCTQRPVHLSSLPSLHALLLPSQGLLSFAESANLSLSIHFDAPGKEMATHFSIAWRTPWTEEPGGLQPVAWQRVKCN